MSFKLSNAAFMFESNGSTVLVAKKIIVDSDGSGERLINRTGVLRTSLNSGYVENILQPLHEFQGTAATYLVGGLALSGLELGPISKYPFASDTNATNVGTLGHDWIAGASSQASASHGYLGGALVPGTGPAAVAGVAVEIFKFPFATTTVAAVQTGGTLQQNLYNTLYVGSYARGGSSSYTHAYSHGVTGGGAYPAGAPRTIQKFPFAIESGTASIVGELTVSRDVNTGHTSSTHGYTSGGSTTQNVIDKFPFTSDGNATDVGNLMPAGTQQHSGHSSTTDGFTAGGGDFGSTQNNIKKFSFSSDGNTTDVGTLITSKFFVTGSSSTTHGYANGGRVVPFAYVTDIEKFPYAISSGSATDVGDLTSAAGDAVSTQD